MLDIRPVLYLNGFVLLILATAMCVPLVVDLATDVSEWQAFALSAMASGFIGLALISANRTVDNPELRTRQAFLVTSGSWLLAAAFGALPFYFGSLHLSPMDSLFEAMSGITTTGATVISGLDTAPRALLLWRSLLQWLGGVGIIVASVALLPMLRIGGMQLFRMESSDKTDKVKARISQVTSSILTIYALFTLALAIALALSGMSPLESVCHAMSSLATGGFSTSDQSLGHFGAASQWICVFGMLVGGATFTQFIAPRKRGRWNILDDSQIRWYLTIIAGFSLLLTLWNWTMRDLTLYDALSQSVFNVVSIISTTGYHTSNYDAWGGFAQVAFFAMAFLGGCTGSTAGGIKIFRYEVLFAVAGVHIRRLLHPSGIFVIDFNGLRLTDAVVRSVLGFMMFYFFCFMLLSLALTILGLDITSAVSGAASALANIGPGLGSVIGPGSSYAEVPDEAKFLLAFGMLVGRLELATVLILFSKTFWRE